MEFIVCVETRLDGRTLEVREVAKLERAAYLAGPEELGLTLKDGKTVLKQVQERIVQMQIQVLSVTERPCMHGSGTEVGVWPARTWPKSRSADL